MYVNRLNMGKRFTRPFQQRKYDLNESTMTNISMDIKYMPNSENGYNYILVMLCEISNFIITAPLYTATSPEICKALQDNLISVFGTPVKLICDQDPAFMSHLTQTLLQSYGTKLITVSPTNHKSLLAEHEELQKKLKYFRQFLQKFRDQRYSLMNRDKEYQGYTAGQIVYLYFSWPKHVEYW